MTVVDRGGRRTVLIANMPTVVATLIDNRSYPQIVEDMEQTFKILKTLKPDIWVAAHASQYDMEAKHKAGSFVDPEGYGKAIAKWENLFRERLAQERARK